MLLFPVTPTSQRQATQTSTLYPMHFPTYAPYKYKCTFSIKITTLDLGSATCFTAEPSHGGYFISNTSRTHISSIFLTTLNIHPLDECTSVWEPVPHGWAFRLLPFLPPGSELDVQRQPSSELVRLGKQSSQEAEPGRRRSRQAPCQGREG